MAKRQAQRGHVPNVTKSIYERGTIRGYISHQRLRPACKPCKHALEEAANHTSPGIVYIDSIKPMIVFCHRKCLHLKLGS